MRPPIQGLSLYSRECNYKISGAGRIKDGNPAMRLGLAKGYVRVEDIINYRKGGD